ncbi:hypothetical protein [Streptosporangium longisporum]|uniref:Uncharacterized protein n=1 Tax=Streptosporangium longisporum TaxID=46187 RepID=A0ABP6L0Z8_9ACTN
MKTVQRLMRRYQVNYNGATWTLPADLLGDSRVVSMMRAARGWGLPIEVTVDGAPVTVRACSWCRARPRVWEWDGATRRELSRCAAPQCLAARRAARAGQLTPPSYLAARPGARADSPGPGDHQGAHSDSQPSSAAAPPFPPAVIYEEVSAMFSLSPRSPEPIGYQVDDERVLCAPGCLSHEDAQARADAGHRAGDVQPWTVDLWPGDPHLTCSRCGRVLVQAPPDTGEDDEETSRV